MNHPVTIIYEGANGITAHHDFINCPNRNRVELVLLDEVNKKNFISLGNGIIIPTRSIIQIKVEEPNEAGE